MTMKFGIPTIALAAMLASSAHAETPRIAIADPVAFADQLRGMGYTVGPIESRDGIPMTSTDIRGLSTVMTFGGCKAGKDCTYLLLITSFSDVINPPAAWLNKANADFDLVKVWTNSSGTATLSHAVVFGDGMPAATFARILEQWQLSAAGVAQSAVAAKIAQ
jgi:hypothetical protein